MSDASPSPGPAGLSVLVVEDDPGDLLLTRHVLGLSDCFEGILTAESVDEAMAILGVDPSTEHAGDACPPDIVLLDVCMPGKSGFDFLQEFADLKARGEFRGVVVAMLSSSSAIEDRERAASFGFVIDYLVKPLKVDDVEHIRGLAGRYDRSQTS